MKRTIGRHPPAGELVNRAAHAAWEKLVASEHADYVDADITLTHISIDITDADFREVIRAALAAVIPATLAIEEEQLETIASQRERLDQCETVIAAVRHAHRFDWDGTPVILAEQIDTTLGASPCEVSTTRRMDP